MKISLEASSLINKNPTGVANYIKNFIRSMADQVSADSIKVLYKLSRLKYKKHWYVPKNARAQVYHGSFLPFIKTADIVHGLDGVVPNWKGSQKVVTIYDILPLMKKDPFISPVSFTEKKEREYRESIESSDLVLTISESTKRDIVEHFQIPESKVDVIYPGIDPDFITRIQVKSDLLMPVGLDRSYLLFVGAVSGRKNTARIVEAYAQSKAKEDFDLVLCGSVSHMGGSTLEAIEKLNVSENVKLLGYLADDEIASLYLNAKGFLFPTLYEGFGFPILEAMLARIPVMTSNIGSAPEVAQEYAIYSDPYDVQSITAGIDLIAYNQNIDLDSAENHALGFTWERSAKKTLARYSQLVAATR